MAGHVIIFDLHAPLPPLLFIPHVQRLFLIKLHCNMESKLRFIGMSKDKNKKELGLGVLGHLFSYFPFRLTSPPPCSCSTAY